MKKHRVKIFALIMVVLAIIAAIVYFEQREEVIEGSLRVTNGTKTVMLNPSKFEQTQVSGVRVNGKGEEIPVNGLGIAIISTSEGLLTDKQARQKHIGGEVLAYVW